MNYYVFRRCYRGLLVVKLLDGKERVLDVHVSATSVCTVPGAAKHSGEVVQSVDCLASHDQAPPFRASEPR